MDPVHEAADVRGSPLLVVDDEVGVLLRDDGTTDPRALEAGGVDEAAGGVAGWVAKDAARGWQAERLVRLAPVADLVEAQLDRIRIGRFQPERGLDDQLRRSVRRRRA